MDKYKIFIYPRAYRDIDGIYAYIAENLQERETALKMVDTLEEAIYSLSQMPQRGSIRRVGAFANKGYRQLFVKNYIIIYTVKQEEKEVHIVTIRYAASNF